MYLFLVNKRTALFMNSVVSFLMFMCDAFLCAEGQEVFMVYTPMILTFIVGFLSIYLVGGSKSRGLVVLYGFLISTPSTVILILLNIREFTNHPLMTSLYGMLSGILSVVFMMATLPFFEWLFNTLTDYRLAEITDHKSKLIKQLIEKASGTFNHCLVVSTLAESCATAIGENALLARACSYYHDIGKLKQPEFFTENQSYGTGYNPHDDLTPELSTDLIRAHAKDGYDIINKYHLPKILADVALQHHGTMPIRYFYMKASKYTEGELDINNFCYYGPKPQTKIAAIVMIVDGSEAKVRSLTDRSHEKVDQATREIIEERLTFGQFDECDITMRDLDIIRRTITNSLAGVYHDRVAYPKLKIKR
ncbi:MAG: HDIG domain-containing protein [Clostridia bacterium]|nr:HDIG domain-containing protein [Clostridia bacterium]